MMFEDFGGRDADPQNAYLGEVESSQIYVGILGRRYGTPLPTRFSATHTEYRHAERRGLRMAVWALETQERGGPQQEFLDEVRAFHVAPTFRTSANLQRQVRERLVCIAAEDLAPWAKLDSIVFRASTVACGRNEINVTARIQSDDVGHALERLAPDGFGAGPEYRFTWPGRSRQVRVTDVRTTTTVASSRLLELRLEITEPRHDSMLGVGFSGQTPDDLTDVALRTALFGEPNQLAEQHMAFIAEMPDPLQPLRDASVPDEIVRPLAELMVTDELIGSGRAARVTKFQLGAAVNGARRLELTWEPPRLYSNETPEPRTLVGKVRL